MEIIHKIIPKNPINSQIQEKMQTKIKEVLEVFGKNYAASTKEIIIKDKEDEVERDEKRKELVKKDFEKKTKFYKDKFGEDSEVPQIPEPPEKGVAIDVMTKYCTKILEMGFKPLRPRGKIEPIKPPELEVKIERYELRDIEFDPYAVYIISARMGKISAQKERRFKEFDKLNSKIKKDLPKDVSLPGASSKFGSRNLNPDFLENRVTQLNNYLTKLSESPEIQKNEDFLFFIGLLPSKNPQDDAIFNEAFRKTKWHFYNWSYIIYDKPEDAISKFLVIEVFRSIRSDIESSLPNAEASRKLSLKVVFKAISGAVDAAVPPAWSAAYKASEPVRVKVQELLGKVIHIFLGKKKDINEKIKEEMIDFFKPIKEAIGNLLKLVIQKVLPPLMKPFSFLIKTYTEVAEPIIIESFKNSDKVMLKEGIDKLNKIHEDVITKLKEEVNESIKGLYVELKGGISLELLHDCFNPMNALGIIISDFVKMIKPDHWGRIVEILFEFKEKLKKDEHNANNILNDMERTTKYYISSEYYRMDWSRWFLKHHITQLALGLDALSEVCSDLGKKVEKQLFKNVCKKFLFKFSDYIWGFTQKKGSDKTWEEHCDEAFVIAYKCAKKKFNKECGEIIKDSVSSVFESMILNKVNDKIKDKIKPALENVNKLIPEDLKDLIDIEEMTNEDIEEILSKTFEKAIDDQEEAFMKELDKSVEECVL